MGLEKKGKTIFLFFYFKETLLFSSLHYYQLLKLRLKQAMRWTEERALHTSNVRIVERKLILGGDWTWEEWSL